MYGGKPKRKTGTKKSSPIRAVVRCAWSGLRLPVPTTGANDDPLPAIRGSSTLLELVLRLESALPPSLFRRDASAGEATLVCLRKLVPQSEWECTTLTEMLDGDDGGAGVVLTLGLGAAADGGINGGSAPQKGSPVNNPIASAASSLNIKPVMAFGAGAGSPTAPAAPAAPAAVTATAPAPAAAAASSLPEPMDISNDAANNNDVPSTAPAIDTMLPEQAWSKVLQSNFDAATKDCLNALLKIIDNLLSRPDDPRVRSVRCANAAFERRVGRCAGGYDFLYSLGFQPRYPAFSTGGTPEFLDLAPENESREALLRGRGVLTRSAVRDLGAEEGPPAPKSAPAPPPQPAATPPGPDRRGPEPGFDVYRSRSHNVQSAALGAPDPYGDAPSSASQTERRLQKLRERKDEMERGMQSEVGTDRGLVAYRPGDGPRATGAAPVAAEGAAGKTDSSLVATRMRRMEEERKKREEGGFTTKAMRDLERMKKAKVYSHAQIQVNFPDGTRLHARFLPRETVSAVCAAIESALRPPLARSLRFDLHVAPPRRALDDARSLEAEGLVPAARVHVGWRAGAAPAGGVAGGYLRDELFVGGGDAAAPAFPSAEPVVKERRTASRPKGGDGGANSGANGGANGDGGGAPSKEDLLMQRMMGKKAGLLGGRKSGGGDGDGAKKSGKPKWFKK